MKELVRHIFQRDYLSKHPVEDLQVASLIRIAEKREKGQFREMEGYPKLLLQKFHEADPRYPQHLYEPIDIKPFLELANQMHATEQLGKSRNREALDYLRYLSREDVKVVRRSVGYYISPDVISHEWTEEEHLYPNAKGALRSNLDYNIRVTTTSD